MMSKFYLSTTYNTLSSNVFTVEVGLVASSYKVRSKQVRGMIALTMTSSIVTSNKPSMSLYKFKAGDPSGL
jgi:hypothetical protein